MVARALLPCTTPRCLSRACSPGPLDYTPGAFGNSNRENFVARNLMPMGLGTRGRMSLLSTLFWRARS